MMNIIGTGLSGLVGSRIVELLSSQYTFEDLSRKTGVDITEKNQVLEKIAKSSSPIVLHFAARTDVDGCENDRELITNGTSWKINVEGTRNVVEACEQTGKKLLYLSTDMVFDGDKPLGGKYSETDIPRPVNWYAVTKFEGERIVQQAKIPWIILRIAYPYRAKFDKKEYVRVFLSRLQNNQEITAVSDHYFTPTFIDDLGNVFDICIQQNITGIFHAGGEQVISPYDAAIIIARTFQLNESLIKQITREEYFFEKAPRPFNLSLKNDKIQQLGIKIRSFEEGMKEVKRQITIT